ncbi:MAG: phosphate/phosphite/phosphonate ABC transporter substrate-binding protein [Defluviitaleaceae bacterium]|nr:phosphate/phosphite/phosphonate ABC transporter substrate-binding protein [Defluviitaleaceae bacterium]MCL2275356.1 phosphate/phosphite/phosphonate ABC transporter substrate-binding protein [Defluviitaleaceae bacterium]
MKRATTLLLAALALAALTVTFTACGLGATRPSGAPDELRIALLVDDGNPQSVAVFEDFRTGLEAHINIPVRIIEDATHIVGIEAMRAGNLDIMWGSPFVYLMAREVMDVERLVVTDNPASINKTVFITAQDDIQTMEDMRGRSFAFISPSSTSGFFYPLYHLMNTLDLTRTQVEAGGFFSTVTFSGGQPASIMGVAHGDFDAAAVGNLNLGNLIRSGVINEGDVRIIGDTAIIPFPGYIASAALPQSLREEVRAFLLAYANEEYFETRFGTHDTRFVLPNDAQIQHLISMAEVLEIDLSEQ